MAGFGANIADAFIDNAADRFVNNFIPGNGYLSSVAQTGVDQWLNNDINSRFGGGLGSTYGYDYSGGNYGGFGSG
ncbi:unnamed protein product [Rotaria socialis]|uniref:Uncharacterized protein n=1 Tax=Rotaria socialis TaxID=392032 RepID=A0A818NB10_9BILA|nr:unnamed protein product [Rotaria socialis]CAF4527927.1 unnamed protein product [Rotaria socialis]